jgi:hypothetical protein
MNAILNDLVLGHEITPFELMLSNPRHRLQPTRSPSSPSWPDVSCVEVESDQNSRRNQENNHRLGEEACHRSQDQASDDERLIQLFPCSHDFSSSVPLGASVS